MSRLGAVVLVALALGATGGPACAAGLAAEVRLEPEAIRPDGLARLVVVVQGPGFRQPRVVPYFELANLEIVGGPDRRQEVQLGTSGSGWRQSFTWHLRPLGPGPAGVEAIHVEVGDQSLSLSPRRIRVTADAPEEEITEDGRPRDRLRDLLRGPRGLPSRRPEASPGRPVAIGGQPRVLLRAVADPRRPYVGQRVVYTVYLYTQIRVASIDADSLPEFAGMWARTIEREARSEQVEWDGELFTRVPLLEKHVYPLRPGAQTIGPVAARLVVEGIERRGFLRVPVAVPVQVSRESNPVTVDVRPLPPVAPALAAAFGGAVGELALEAAVAPSVLGVGEGASLSVTVRGNGNLDAMPPPAIRLPAGLELMPPEEVTPASGESTDDQPGDGTTRSWRYVVVPRRPGRWELPPVEVAYFDPGTETYRLARAELGAVHAHPPAIAEDVPGGGNAGDGAAADDLLPADASALPAAMPIAWRRLLPWGLAVPVLAALVLLGLRRRAPRRAHPPASDRAPRFDAALAEERPRRAAAALEAAWRRQLEALFDLPPTSPPARWPDEVRARGADPADAEALAELLADLHYLRYAPELSTTASLARELVARSGHLARRLESNPGAQRSVA